jgi:hypothetical protein
VLERLHYCHFGTGETNVSSGKLFSTVIITRYMVSLEEIATPDV